jgi:enoyl-CoA hydratase/carnithine racemase
MTLHERLGPDGVVELVFDHPPVNAFNIADLLALARQLLTIHARPEVHCVLIHSEGRGFCGGGDLKEVQSLPGFEGILGQAAGSYEASLAIAECAVPVVVAVHNYCVGVGVLLAGAADIVVAERGTSFVMAEVDNGATGGAIQAIGLMPEGRLRAAMFTCEPVLADELHRLGTVYRLTEPGEYLTTARDVAATIARKSPSVVRRAKASIDRSIGRDIRRAYRVELSYTYELNLIGDAARARQTFLDGEREGYPTQSG